MMSNVDLEVSKSAQTHDGEHSAARERERAAILVLRCSRFKSHFARFEIDVTPFERQHFGLHAPARDEGETHDRAQILG
jgi:hypothetical protein